MSALRGTDEGRALMASVRAHRQTKEPMADKFIQKAIKRPGALTAKAKAAGQSISEFANAHKGDKGVTGDESRFYLNVLAKVGPKKSAAKPDKDADDAPALKNEADVASAFMAKRKK